MSYFGKETSPPAAKLAFSAEQAGSGAHQAIERISDAVHPAVSRATSGAHRLVDRISDSTSRMSQRIEQTANRLKDREQRMVAASSGYVREHPFRSAGLALAAGFLVSQLVSSRKTPPDSE